MQLIPYSKLPNVGTTIFSVISAKAAEHHAVNVAQGFPDFDPDPLLLEFAYEAMRAGKNQYALMTGSPALRQHIANLQTKHHGHRWNVDSEITVTVGAAEALFTAIQTVVQPGNEVIVLEPAYDLYVPAIKVAGGKPVLVPLNFPDFKPDWNRVEAAITSNTRLIILNTPHNPTGQLLDTDDFQALARLIDHKEIYVIADEVYEFITFDGKKHISAATNELIRERVFVVGSFGKSLHITGWRVGFACAPAQLTREFRKIHQYNTFSAAAPLQEAIANYITAKPTFYQDIQAFFQTKRDTFAQMLGGCRLKPHPTYGSYFQLFSFYDIAPNESDHAFVDKLIKQYGVAAIPASSLYEDGTDHKLLRLCFAKQDSTLKTAAQRLCQL